MEEWTTGSLFCFPMRPVGTETPRCRVGWWLRDVEIDGSICLFLRVSVRGGCAYYL